MNRLSTAKRTLILGMLVEGRSMRSIERLTGTSINTVKKLLEDAGEACAAYHHDNVRGIKGNRTIECDEIWAFVYAKQRNVPRAKAAPNAAVDVWTWTAIDANSKLIVSYLVASDREGATALALMDDLRLRLEDRPQISTGGLKGYIEAVEGAFGGDVDFAQVKQCGKEPGINDERHYSPAVCTKVEKRAIDGDPDMAKANTSSVERQHLTTRMGMRRSTRLTNAFSKRIEKHAAMVALYALYYNFCRIHGTLKVTPAMEAGLSDTVRDLEWIVGLIDANAPMPNKPGPKPGTRHKPRKTKLIHHPVIRHGA